MTYRKLLAAASLTVAPLAIAHAAPSPAITAAVADKSRPAEDIALDEERKPAEMLEFAGIKPGMTVEDILPGGGYFTRLFVDVVGPKGKVVAWAPDEMLNKSKDPAKAIERLTALGKIGPNVMAIHDPLLNPPPKNMVDVAWTSQNYHDLHNIPGADIVAFNKMIFQLVKPGGVYVVLDHAAPAGSGLSNANTTHRIDPAVVKQEVTAAGFEYVGESKVLANPADDHSLNVFDKAIRRHTDQFIYKFRKPKK